MPCKVVTVDCLSPGAEQNCNHCCQFPMLSFPLISGTLSEISPDIQITSDWKTVFWWPFQKMQQWYSIGSSSSLRMVLSPLK